jgi:hypothetical protein
MKLIVLTVLRSSAEYGPDKVLAIKGMLEKHLTLPYEFVCLSDTQIDGVRVIPLAHDWPSWYAKMELFRPDLPEGPKFYLDLDTIIVANIDNLIEQAFDSDNFVILRDFYRGSRDPWAMGSGLMFWNIPCTHLYRFFAADPRPVPGGDQVLLERWLDRWNLSFWQDLTESVCSFKVHVRPYGRVDPKYSIICFHGQPRPWSSTQDIIPYK